MLALPLRSPQPALALALVSLVTIAAPSAGAAQAAPPPASRVRITAAAMPKPIVGRLLAADSGSLTLVTADTDTLRIPSDAVQGIEVSGGRRSRVGRGALIGGMTVGLVGLFGGVAAGSSSSAWSTIDSGDAGMLMVLGAGLGAGLGALVGLAVSGERWTPWPAGARALVAPSVGPSAHGGVRVGLELSTDLLAR